MIGEIKIMEKVQIVANAIIAAMPLTWPNASAQEALDAINQVSEVMPMSLLDMFSKAEDEGAKKDDLWKLFEKDTSPMFLEMFVQALGDGRDKDCRKLVEGAVTLKIFSQDTADAIEDVLQANALTYLQIAFLAASQTEEPVSIIDTQAALDYLTNGA